MDMEQACLLEVVGKFKILPQWYQQFNVTNAGLPEDVLYFGLPNLVQLAHFRDTLGQPVEEAPCLDRDMHRDSPPDDIPDVPADGQEPEQIWRWLQTPRQVMQDFSKNEIESQLRMVPSPPGAFRNSQDEHAAAEGSDCESEDDPDVLQEYKDCDEICSDDSDISSDEEVPEEAGEALDNNFLQAVCDTGRWTLTEARDLAGFIASSNTSTSDWRNMLVARYGRSRRLRRGSKARELWRQHMQAHSIEMRLKKMMTKRERRRRGSRS